MEKQRVNNTRKWWDRYKDVAAVRGLLDWLGWRETVGAVISAAGVWLWSHFAHLRGPEQFALTLGVFASVVVLIHQGLSVRDRMREKGNLSIELTSVEACESLHQETTPMLQAHHRIYIDFNLKVSNGDGQNASTIEPVICIADFRDKECDSLGFVQNPHANLIETDPRCRPIPPGAIRPLTLRAIFDLPVSDTYIPAAKLKGRVTLRDNRAQSLPPVPFVVELRKMGLGEKS